MGVLFYFLFLLEMFCKCLILKGFFTKTDTTLSVSGHVHSVPTQGWSQLNIPKTLTKCKGGATVVGMVEKGGCHR